MTYSTDSGRKAAERAKELLIRASTSCESIPAVEIIKAVDAIVEAAVAEAISYTDALISQHEHPEYRP